MTGCRVPAGSPAMRLHKRQRASQGGKSFYSTPMQAAQESDHFCHDWVAQFPLLVASWESLAVARPLWETGLWAADIGRRRSRCKLS